MNYNLENVSQLSNLFKETSIDYGWRVFLIHWLRPYQTKSVKTLQRFCRRMSGYYVKNNKYGLPDLEKPKPIRRINGIVKFIYIDCFLTGHIVNINKDNTYNILVNGHKRVIQNIDECLIITYSDHYKDIFSILLYNQYNYTHAYDHYYASSKCKNTPNRFHNRNHPRCINYCNRTYTCTCEDNSPEYIWHYIMDIAKDTTLLYRLLASDYIDMETRSKLSYWLQQKLKS